MYAKEGFITVSLSWIILSLFGSFPFIISGSIPNFFDALFETVSGFSTTGASILSDVEALPRSMLFWRSFTHWIGGMGVLVFLLAVGGTAGIHTCYFLTGADVRSDDNTLIGVFVSGGEVDQSTVYGRGCLCIQRAVADSIVGESLVALVICTSGVYLSAFDGESVAADTR